MEISNPTLSHWECDRLYPTWPYWPRIVAYLGYDPFTDPALGGPKGNGTPGVASLSIDIPPTIGQQMLKRRIQMKKTRSEFARELGISVKSVWGWEAGRHKISQQLRERIEKFLA